MADTWGAFDPNEERDPFGRIQPEHKPEQEISNLGNPAQLSQSVGEQGKNQRPDVAKVEAMLGKVGTLDLKKTDGPTGYWGERTREATRSFQKKNGLKVDGQINTNGETIKKLAEANRIGATKRRKERRDELKRRHRSNQSSDSDSPYRDTLENMMRDKLESDAKKELIKKITRDAERKDAVRKATEPKKPSRPIRGGGGGVHEPWRQKGLGRGNYDPYEFLDM